MTKMKINIQPTDRDFIVNIYVDSGTVTFHAPDVTVLASLIGYEIRKIYGKKPDA